MEKLKNNLMGGLAAIVLSASSFSTQAQDPNFSKFKDTEQNQQIYLKLIPEIIEQTPNDFLKLFNTSEPIYIRNYHNRLIDFSYIPEPKKERNYEKYDKLRWKPSKGDYQ